MYDAAHVSLYGATGCSPNALHTGADIVITSTHKLLGGPVGGLVLTQRTDLARRLCQIPFPGLLQTRDQNKLAATAHSLCEMIEYGGAYARQTISNARALAHALDGEGFDVFAKARGATATHQVFVNVGEMGARPVEERCQAAHILLHAAHMAGDSARGSRTGLRITVQEMTRRGMKEGEMDAIADLIARAAYAKHADDLKADVALLAGAFPSIHYSFDD